MVNDMQTSRHAFQNPFRTAQCPGSSIHPPPPPRTCVMSSLCTSVNSLTSEPARRSLEAGGKEQRDDENEGRVSMMVAGQFPLSPLSHKTKITNRTGDIEVASVHTSYL